VKLFGADVVLFPKKEAAKVILIAAVGIPLALFVWRQNVRREHSRGEHLTFLRSLAAASLTAVRVSDPHGTALRSVTDSAALASFVDAVHFIEVYQPNHPSYTHNFVAKLDLNGGSSLRYEFHTIFPADETIYIDFPSGGNGKSKQLFEWMHAQGFL
jgi:hypothetical protein